jgi:DNA polymerase elongation subunit (family B)
MIINYNISFDTVNCSCCKDDLSACVPKEVSSVKDYWICRKVKGIFTELMENFTSERLRQQKIGNETQSQGLKILINSGYGVFGYRFFKYYNRDVAILVAAYGRYILTKMQEMADDCCCLFE